MEGKIRNLGVNPADEESIVVVNHLFRILKKLEKLDNVINANDSVQIITESWDEIPWTFTVNKNLSLSIKENDIVIIQYESNAPRRITKVWRGEEAEETWKRYKKYHIEIIKPQREQQKTQATQTQAQVAQQHAKADLSYIG